ncbi:MAG TPA: rod-binding protein [Gemmataceae bacterium]|nr:rod-binding protein [Gemmataceae bacterium]
MIGPVVSFEPQLSAPFGVPGAMDGKSKPSLKDAAQGFESVFLSMLLKEMRQTLEPGSLFGSDSSDIYGGLFDQFMAQHLAQGKGMGLAHALMKQLEPSSGHGASHSNSAPRS